MKTTHQRNNPYFFISPNNDGGRPIDLPFTTTILVFNMPRNHCNVLVVRIPLTKSSLEVSDINKLGCQNCPLANLGLHNKRQISKQRVRKKLMEGVMLYKQNSTAETFIRTYVAFFVLLFQFRYRPYLLPHINRCHCHNILDEIFT